MELHPPALGTPSTTDFRRHWVLRLAGDEIAERRVRTVLDSEETPSAIPLLAVVKALHHLRTDFKDDADLRRSAVVLVGNALVSTGGGRWTRTRRGELRASGWDPDQLLARLLNASQVDPVAEELIRWLT